MEFGKALNLLKQGKKVARVGWNGKGQWVGYQAPDKHSKMQCPYAYLHPVNGALIPWSPSQSDMFADDWQEV